MSANIDFEVCPIDCSTFKFVDTTCVNKPYNPYFCLDGYNIPGGLNVYDVDSTLFNFIMPDGTDYTDVDINYNVGRKARIEFQLLTYASGFVYIELGSVSLGTPILTVDVATSVQTIISTINGGVSVHGWNAYLKAGTTDTIIVEAQEYGLTWNNQQMDFSISNPGITFDFPNGDLTLGANGFSDEYCFGMAEITSVDCYDGKLPCGVYKMTYRLMDDGGNEIQRKTKYVLNDYCIRSAIKEWILLMQKKACCTSEMDERVLELRLMHEKATVQFNNAMYDCAQETIDKAIKYMNNICLDC
jgi:hypothetical protein